MTRSHVLLAALLGASSGQLLKAVPVPCASLNTLADYIASVPGGGCFNQDKLYTDFSYTGGGSITAAQVRVTPIFNAASPPAVNGLIFTPIAGVGVWTSGFTIAYSVSAAPPQGAPITGAKVQVNLGVGQDNPAVGTSTKGNGVVLEVGFSRRGSQGAGSGLGPKPTGESDSASFTAVNSLTSSTTVTIPSGGFVISLEEVY